MKNVCAIIFSAGKGTRMNNSLPKVLLKLGNQPIIFWVLKTLKSADIKNIIVVVGYKANLVKKTILAEGFKVKFIEQKKLLGTADSLKVSLDKIPDKCDTLLILFGDDSAFYKQETILEFLNYHIKNRNKATFLTSYLEEPNPIGGLNLDDEGRVLGVLRQSEIIKNNLKKYPILCGAFCFDKDWIVKNISKIEKSDLSGEYTLPSIYKVALENGEYVNTFSLKNHEEWMSINTPEELKVANLKEVGGK